MKKVLAILGVICFFFLGLSIGGSFSKGASNIFEEAKDEFESNIESTEEYDTKPLVPEENIVNKTAHTIDGFLTEKLKNVIDKLFE